MFDFLLDHGSVGAITLLGCGLALLVGGGGLLVRNASRFGLAVGLSPVFVGLTLVSTAACAPETVIAVAAARHDLPGIAVGNIVGSCTVNLLLVLGLAACVGPLRLSGNLTRNAFLCVILAATLVFFLALGGNTGDFGDLVSGEFEGRLTVKAGAILLVTLVLYICLTLWIVARREDDRPLVHQIDESIRLAGRKAPNRGPVAATIAGISSVIIASAMLVLGSDMLIKGAEAAGKLLGFDDLLIGLTFLAVGTSLPEFVVTITAARGGHRELAVAAIVGSCLFNLLAVFGLTTLLTPGGLTLPGQAMQCDLPFLILAAALCMLLGASGRRFSRPEGMLMVAFYGFYLFLLFITALSSP